MSTETTKPNGQSTIAALQTKPERIENLPSVSVGLTSLQGFELVQRAAKCLAASTLVPKEYQANISNCVVALNMAQRVGADPLMVMQNLVIVHGRPTWSSQFMISTVNSCGRFTALRYEFFGKQGEDSWGCRAWAIEKATDEKLVGTDVTIALAKAEGWYGKNGSKWKTMPQQMLMYRAGSWWARAYAPELSMGLHAAEEMVDVYDAERQQDGSYSVKVDDLRNGSAGDNNVIIDGETGEITDVKSEEKTEGKKAEAEPLQPAKIPAKALPGDATKTDWDGWAEEWEKLVAGMHDGQSLEKLKKLNEAVLGNLQKINPPKYNHCMELFSSRMAQVGGVQ